MTDYNRTPEAQETFKEKRKPKGPIKFKLSLNEEQKQAKELILQTPVTLIKGLAGSGKTLVATQIALDLVFRREMEKIVIKDKTYGTPAIERFCYPINEYLGVVPFRDHYKIFKIKQGKAFIGTQFATIEDALGAVKVFVEVYVVWI